MNKSREDYIKKFHEVFGKRIHAEPTVELLKLRKTLLKEEVGELSAAIDTAIAFLEKGESVPRDVYANMLKEMGDVQVVLSGTSVELKPLKRFDEAFKRVYESNMSKLDNEGKPILREDGKVLKGPNYSEPDLSDLV